MNHHESYDFLERCAIHIGRSAYERSFGITFFDKDNVLVKGNYNFRTRILSSSSCGLRMDFCGQKVAVVGNGEVTSGGANIDAHDQVIRISGMRNWRKRPDIDGIKTTLWAGHPAFVVDRDEAGTLHVNPAFEMLVRSGVDLWALSPFHITCDSYLWLKCAGRWQDVLIAPSPAMLFDRLHSYMSAEEVSLLFSIPTGRRHLTGLTNFELLLTGTRLVLLLEACGVDQISLYGFDLFKDAPNSAWFGHDLSIDRKLLCNAMRRFIESGRVFHWQDGESITSEAE